VSVQKKYVALMLLRAYRAAELLANTPEDNIEMNNTGVALISMGVEINFLNI
jgi:uncharacterized membrane protein YjfL (UPF0719 family)